MTTTAGNYSGSVEQAVFYQRAMGAVDTRTVEILERRRRTATVRRRGWLVKRTLTMVDAFALALALLCVEIVNDSVDLRMVFVAVPAWIIGATIYGLYTRDEVRADHTTVEDIVRAFHLITVGAWLSFCVTWVLGDPIESSELLAFWASALAIVILARSLARAWLRRQLTYLQNTVIVGGGAVGQLLARKLLQHPEYGLNLVGFVDDSPKERRADLGHLALLGPADRLPELVHLFDVERVIIAYSNDPHEKIVEMIRSLGEQNIQIDIVPRLFDLIGPSVCTHSVEGLPLVGLPPVRHSRVAFGIKRCIDIVGASVGLIIAAPMFAVVALMIKRDSPGPVFFRQARLGRNMQEFTLLKFRTMTVNTDEALHRAFIESMSRGPTAPAENGLFKLERSSDLTKLGGWLRRSSLDELPQLINVLRGEMALVGPRPCISYETEQFAPHHYARFSVPAGITGLWQTTARAHSTFHEALDMDVAYARAWSLSLDFVVMLRTVRQLAHTTSTA